MGVIAGPHSKKGDWIFTAPISLDEFRTKAIGLGVHPIDIQDALDSADTVQYGFVG